MKTKEQVLDEYFPKGNKKRGEAMYVLVVAYLEGRDKVLKIIEDCKSWGGSGKDRLVNVREIKERLEK